VSDSEEQRSALVVAVWEYEDPQFRQLRSPSADAEALASVLADKEVGRYCVETSLNEDESIVTRRLERFFADRGRDDQLLLHLSCHGVKDDDGELYFAAANTELRLLNSTAIPASLLTKLVNRSEAGRVVVFLDCCYSGAFTGELVARGDDDVQVVERFARSGEGRAVITASKATEYAFEDNELSRKDPRPSVFTSALVHGLKTGEADLDRDGLISFSDIYAYVYDEVRKVTKLQTPGVFTKLEGRLYLADSLRPAELPGPIQDAVASPLASSRAGVVSDLKRLLDGNHPGYAAAALRALSKLADEDSDLVVRETAQKALEGTDLPPPPPRTPPPPPPTPPPTPPSPPIRERRRLADIPRRAWAAAAAAVLVGLVLAGAYLALRDGDDALTWTTTDAPSLGGSGRQVIRAIAAGSGDAKAFAVGFDGSSGTVWSRRSEDWVTEQLLPKGVFYAVASSGSSAAAAGRTGPAARGQSATIWRRTSEWRRACPTACGDMPIDAQGPPPRAQEIRGIVPLQTNAGRSFVLVGGDQNTNEPGLTYDAAVWRLDPGAPARRLAIRERSFRGPGQQRMNAVAVTPSGVFAVGQFGQNAGVWRSPDAGLSWTRLEDEALAATAGPLVLNAVVAHGQTVVVVGSESNEAGTNQAAVRIWREGSGWSSGTSSDFSHRGQAMLGVTEVDGLLVAVGYDHGEATPRAAVWTSEDGTTWKLRSGVPEAEESMMTGVIAVADELIAVGYEGPNGDADGQVWTASAPRGEGS